MPPPYPPGLTRWLLYDSATATCAGLPHPALFSSLGPDLPAILNSKFRIELVKFLERL